MTGDDLVANSIVNTRWETLPDAVKHKIRMCLVDSVAATLAGRLARVSQITADYAAEAWRGDQATILLHAKRSTAVGATLANAWTAKGVDGDDGAQYMRTGTPGLISFPWPWQ